MIKTLVHDAETGELRVRYHDVWQGNHEVTEYRVTDMRGGGDVVRNRPDLDGRPVLGMVPSLYYRIQRAPWDVRIWAEETPAGETVTTPCPKAANARRKCALCGAGN
jgi:hypothetical protein